MPTINYIPLFSSLIPQDFISTSGTIEEEPTEMSLPIDDSGTQCLVCKFDRDLDKIQYPKGLFPFFNKVPSAHSMCDYIIFAQQKGQLFCLTIELKRGRSQTHPQLYAGELFSRFIVNTCNRINGLSLSPKYRHIAIHNCRITKKGPTKMKPLTYSQSYAEFKGGIFDVKECLK